MIRKNFFLAIIIAIGGLFTWACGDKNKPDVPHVNPTETNDIILKTIQDNYLWNTSESPSKMTETKSFFSKLLNPKDTLSWIKKIADIPIITTTHDIGFEYVATTYDNNKTHYVILYVKKGSVAEKRGIKRGYVITHVSPNGQKEDKIEVSGNKNDKGYWETLLPNCIKSGQQFSILYRIPGGSEASSTFKPNDVIVPVSQRQDPLYYSNADIYPASGKKIGYIVYNHFLSADQYLSPLISKLNDFKNKEVSTLILDLRYNATGGYSYLSALGSSLVKSKDKEAAFAYLVKEDANKDIAYKFSDDKNIQNLGDQLENIYIITGVNTAGPAETLIHALRAYWGDKLIVTGENSQGKNMVAGTKDIKLEDGTAEWRINITLGRLGDKNKNYSYRTKVNNELKEINTKSGTEELLKPLGDIKEYVLKNTLEEISGMKKQSTVRSSKVANSPALVKNLGSSITSEQEIIFIDNLRY